jgi:hypothetical protein
MSNKVDFKWKYVARDKVRHDIMIKAQIHQEDIAIINVCAPNIGVPKYINKC